MNDTRERESSARSSQSVQAHVRRVAHGRDGLSTVATRSHGLKTFVGTQVSLQLEAVDSHTVPPIVEASVAPVMEAHFLSGFRSLGIAPPPAHWLIVEACTRGEIGDRQSQVLSLEIAFRDFSPDKEDFLEFNLEQISFDMQWAKDDLSRDGEDERDLTSDSTVWKVWYSYFLLVSGADEAFDDDVGDDVFKGLTIIDISDDSSTGFAPFVSLWLGQPDERPQSASDVTTLGVYEIVPDLDQADIPAGDEIDL